MNFLDMKDDSLLLPVRFEVHFEIVSLDKTLDVERFEVHFESNIGYKNDVIRLYLKFCIKSPQLYSKT